MWKFIVGISTIMVVALSTSGFDIQSDFHVAGANDNMYIKKPGCTPNGTNFFYNFGNCSASGSSCTLMRGTTVQSTLRVTPTVKCANPSIRLKITWRPGTVVVQDGVHKLAATFLANQTMSFSEDVAIRDSFVNDYDVDLVVVCEDGTTLMCSLIIFFVK